MAKKKEVIPFYVINEDMYKRRTFGPYDIMPYLIEEYKDTKKSKHRKTPETFEEFKEFVKDKCLYQYWGRCEYEVLIGSWPFGSYKMRQEVKEFIKKEPNLDDYRTDVDFLNIITQDMQKMDVYEQVMMNHDTVTKILMENVGATGKEPVKKNEQNKKA